MKSAFEADLIEALDNLEAGMPLEEILARYPQQAEQLRPILETGAQLSTLPVAHSLSAQAASRDGFLKQAAALRDQEQNGVVAPVSLWRRLAFSLASLAVVVMLLGGVVAGAAREALPGQALYPVKRTLEEVRLSLASDPAGQEALEAQFRRERQEEINALLAAGLEGTVECEGILQAIAADSWKIDGLEVAIEPATTISGNPEIGSTVRGTCEVTKGQVVGKTLLVEAQRHPAPSPSATPTAPSTPTAPATPTATVTPTTTDPSATLEGNTIIQPDETDEAEQDDDEVERDDEAEQDDDEAEPDDDEAEQDDDEAEQDDDEAEQDDDGAEQDDDEAEQDDDGAEQDDDGAEQDDEAEHDDTVDGGATEGDSDPDDDADSD